VNHDDFLTRESIRATMSRYAVAADCADYAELAACFCPQGVLIVAGGLSLSGREAIATELTRRARARGHGIRSDIFQRHIIGTSHIVCEEKAARATTYYLVITEQGPDHAGRYMDQFSPYDTQWLLTSREATMDWVNPSSRFASLKGASRTA